MTSFNTALDLKTDALRLAGEPQDGSSQFDAIAYDFLTSVQNALISGGLNIGPTALQPFDWWWARADPRGVIQLQLPTNGDYGVAATFTQDSTEVILGSPLDVPERTRLWIDTTSTRPFVRLQDSSASFVLHDPWPEATITTSRWLAFLADYTLPTDFVRFASPIFISGWPYQIDVWTPEALERTYPFSCIAAGIPTAAAQITPDRLRFSHYLPTIVQGAVTNNNLQVEFEYIARPDQIEEGNTPPVPYEHRRVLSYGAAWLMAEDRSDQFKTGQLAARFETQYKAMKNEHRQNLRDASSKWGVVVPRAALSDPKRFRMENGTVWWW